MHFTQVVKRLRYALLIGATTTGILIGTYLHPLPIARDWGDIASRDMAAKAELAYEAKGALDAYSKDGVWNGNELLQLSILTYPGRFTEHRIPEFGPLFGFIPRYDSPIPSSALEDALHLKYSLLFSDGTKAPEGEFASYVDAVRALSLRRYETFVNRDRVTYEEYLKGLGFDRAKTDESSEEYLRRHFTGSVPIDISLASQLNAELDRMIGYFSSEENQNKFKMPIDDMAYSRDGMYNAILLSIAGLASSMYGLSLIDRRLSKNNRSRSAARKTTA